MKKTLVYLSCSALLIIVTLMLLVSKAKMPNKVKNGFTRVWMKDIISPLHDAKNKTPLNKICGVTDHNIFFTVPNPRWLVMMDKNLTQQDTFSFPIPLQKQYYGAGNMIVDSPLIYYYINNLPGLLHGELNGQKVDNVNLQTEIFTKSLFIEPHCFIIRGFSKNKPGQTFQKISSSSGQILKQETILDEQIDRTGFATDGILKYDKSTNRIFFIQSFLNQIFCLDTNLNIIYRNKTIDTINTNTQSIKLINYEGKNKIMPTTPRTLVNKDYCVDAKYIYVVSVLKADNEEENTFKSNSAIDVYHAENGVYKGSFYLPNQKRENIKSFYIQNDTLIVLYNTHISTYKITAR